MRAAVRLAMAGIGLPLAAPASVPPPTTLTVYAAASLTDAFTELGRLMERRYAGLKVRFNFAGSQQLVSQLEQGAAADVFASADQRWMDCARRKVLVASESPIFATNRLVVIVPRFNPAHIGRLEDLSRAGIKLVLAAETVPAGRYTLVAIRKLATAPGFPSEYESRVLENVVSQEENVKSVVAKVQLGEADAGVVYRSDVTPAVAGAVRMFEIPARFNVTANYPGAILQASENPNGARQFLELLLSDQGQRVLLQHGFSLGPAATPSATHP